MSTYSPSLRIELITTGDQAGTWGNTTNTNLGTLIESGICGYTSVSVTTANQALTALNGAADQSRNMVLALTTTTTAAFNVYAPPAEKVYIIFNASPYTATIYNSTVIGNTTAAGIGVPIPAGKTMTVWSDGTNFSVQNDHLASLTLGTDLAIADGGTGASTASGARTNLGLGTIATQNANSVTITGGSITGITPLAVADGGTGAANAAAARGNLGVTATGQDTTYLFRANNLSDLTNSVTARNNLGLGSIATQNSNSVTITGGSISGITPLAVTDGGTGANNAATARSNLGVTATGQDTTYLFRANNLSDLNNAATARSNLGLGSMATQNANGVSISGGTVNNVSMSSPTITGGLISGLAAPIALASGGTGATDAAGARSNLGVTATGQDTTYLFRANNLSDLTNATTARSNLGLGSMATQNANAVSISGGSITGITDLAVADGGTGASTAAGARTNLGLTIGTDVPSPTGAGASGTWNINISGNAATASNGGVTSVNGLTGALSLPFGYNCQVFTNSGSFTPPTGVTQVLVVLFGGGGGGASFGLAGRAGGAGAAILNVVPGVAYSVNLGAGGNGAVSTGSGGTGGATSFSTLATATGGQGAVYSNSALGVAGTFTVSSGAGTLIAKAASNGLAQSSIGPVSLTGGGNAGGFGYYLDGIGDSYTSAGGGGGGMFGGGGGTTYSGGFVGAGGATSGPGLSGSNGVIGSIGGGGGGAFGGTGSAFIPGNNTGGNGGGGQGGAIVFW